MDSYLESLVRKGEIVEEKAKAAESENVSVESAENVAIVENSTSEQVETVSEEAQTEVTQSEETETRPEEPELKIPDHKVGDTFTVKDIKVFNVPDNTGLFKIISGNVTYIGTINNFDIIYYMKYGFGLIKGYTQDL